MKRTIYYLLCFLLVASQTACNNASENERSNSDTTNNGNTSKDVRANIEEQNNKFMQAFKSKDSASLAAMYASDGWVMPPGGESIKGKDISGFWGGAFHMGIAEAKLNIQDITQGNNLAVETGTYEMLDSTGKPLDKGKYVVVWKNENGQWKLYRDIWNSNGPINQ